MEPIASRSPIGNVPFQKVGTLKTQHSKLKSRLKRIQDWETLAKDAGYDVTTMAAICPISLRQLERFFKLHFGTNPRSWAMELQCRHARELIKQGYSNKAVVAELHFADESHLCHVFKKAYGCPPQTFARLWSVCRPKTRMSSGDKS